MTLNYFVLGRVLSLGQGCTPRLAKLFTITPRNHLKKACPTVSHRVPDTVAHRRVPVSLSRREGHGLRDTVDGLHKNVSRDTPRDTRSPRRGGRTA